MTNPTSLRFGLFLSQARKIKESKKVKIGFPIKLDATFKDYLLIPLQSSNANPGYDGTEVDPPTKGTPDARALLVQGVTPSPAGADAKAEKFTGRFSMIVDIRGYDIEVVKVSSLDLLF